MNDEDEDRRNMSPESGRDSDPKLELIQLRMIDSSDLENDIHSQEQDSPLINDDIQEEVKDELAPLLQPNNLPP